MVSGHHMADVIEFIADVIELIGRPQAAQEAGVRGPEFAASTKTFGER
jgi:hypothetical protein